MFSRSAAKFVGAFVRMTLAAPVGTDWLVLLDERQLRRVPARRAGWCAFGALIPRCAPVMALHAPGSLPVKGTRP